MYWVGLCVGRGKFGDRFGGISSEGNAEGGRVSSGAEPVRSALVSGLDPRLGVSSVGVLFLLGSL